MTVIVGLWETRSPELETASNTGRKLAGTTYSQSFSSFTEYC